MLSPYLCLGLIQAWRLWCRDGLIILCLSFNRSVRCNSSRVKIVKSELAKYCSWAGCNWVGGVSDPLLLNAFLLESSDEVKTLFCFAADILLWLLQHKISKLCECMFSQHNNCNNLHQNLWEVNHSETADGCTVCLKSYLYMISTVYFPS